jgi:hypothetical protein
LTSTVIGSESYLGLPSASRIAPLGNSLTLEFNGSIGSLGTVNTSELILNFRDLIRTSGGGSISCSGGLTCTFTTISTKVNQIKITSPSSSNFFAAGVTSTVVISGLLLDKTSNGEDRIF